MLRASVPDVPDARDVPEQNTFRAGRIGALVMVTERFRAVARKRWPRALWVAGNGQFGLVSTCPPGCSVELFERKADAEAVKKTIDDTGCGGCCRSQHSIVDLGTSCAILALTLPEPSWSGPAFVMSRGCPLRQTPPAKIPGNGGPLHVFAVSDRATARVGHDCIAKLGEEDDRGPPPADRGGCYSTCPEAAPPCQRWPRAFPVGIEFGGIPNRCRQGEFGEIDLPGELNRCRGRIPRTCVSVRLKRLKAERRGGR